MQFISENEDTDNHRNVEPKSLWRLIGTVAIVVAGFLGGWNYGGPSFADYPEMPSVADDYCKHLWTRNAKNDPALLCYLTTLPERLCRPTEKQSFVALVALYRNHTNQFQRDLQTAYNAPRWATLTRPGEFIAALYETVMIVGDDGTFSSTAHPKSGTPGSGPQPLPNTYSMQKLQEHFRADAKRFMSPTLPEAMKVHRVPYHQLVDALRSLHKNGYINKSDFGWFPDSFVLDALGYETSAVSDCPIVR
jgi:hypothetical protein